MFKCYRKMLKLEVQRLDTLCKCYQSFFPLVLLAILLYAMCIRMHFCFIWGLKFSFCTLFSFFACNTIILFFSSNSHNCLVIFHYSSFTVSSSPSKRLKFWIFLLLLSMSFCCVDCTIINPNSGLSLWNCFWFF